VTRGEEAHGLGYGESLHHAGGFLLRDFFGPFFHERARDIRPMVFLRKRVAENRYFDRAA